MQTAHGAPFCMVPVVLPCAVVPIQGCASAKAVDFHLAQENRRRIEDLGCAIAAIRQ